LIRVCHIISGLGTGGAETMLYNLAGRMDRTRFEPSVISLIDTGSVGERIERAGVPVRALGMKRGAPSPSGLFHLKKALREWRPDVIQGWMYHGNLAATLGAALAGGTVPLVWGIHHSLYDIARERPLTRTVIRLCARLSGRPAATVYVSRLSAAQHAEFGFRDRCREIIPNGFDGERFRPDSERRAAIRRELGIGGGQVLIGLIARYHPMKDHGNFLRAAARLAGTRPEARFLLAGTGVEARNGELSGMIETLGLAGRVDLLGERGDVADLMAALDILCMSSSHGEAFPMVVGEAMASGLPCAVTDVGDAGWLVGETGRVVPPKNADALAAALAELVGLGSEGRRTLGMAARRRIQDEFSLERNVEAYQALYEQLAGR
jgi:glycosyltransferase involved in cell wall biosynthesis